MILFIKSTPSPSPAPFPLAKHVYYDGLAADGDGDFAVRLRKRMRRNLTQLHPRASDDVVWLVFRAGQPTDIFVTLKHSLKFVPRLGTECLK